MLRAALVFIGAGTGGLLRYWLAAAAHARFGVTPPAFPLGTLIVNISGCLAIGVLMVVVSNMTSDTARDNARAALLIGLLGGYTTFSALGKETLELVQAGQAVRAAMYVTASVLGGLAAVWMGWAIASRVLTK